MNQVAVVIPIYKTNLKKSESVSLVRAISVFRSRKIILVAPKGIKLQAYKAVLEGTHENYKFEFFDPIFFKNIETYNQLMLNTRFYSRFSSYKYILIYQLDCYVFNDELDYWCNLEYDYIGAPWIRELKGHYTIEKYAGNGGFSLRKVSSLIKILQIRRNIVHNPLALFKEYAQLPFWQFLRKTPLLFLRIVGYKNNSSYFLKTNRKKEDYFWAIVAPKIQSDFKVINGYDAVGFAFEKYPSFLFSINQNKLPFGCHGWTIYEPDFWSAFITQ